MPDMQENESIEYKPSEDVEWYCEVFKNVSLPNLKKELYFLKNQSQIKNPISLPIVNYFIQQKQNK